MTRLEPGLEFLPGLVLVRPLGRGGMGEVWVARDGRRDEEVVAKLVPRGAPGERVALLRREARLVRKLEHPSIVPVYGFEQAEAGSAVLFRYMTGGDASRLRGAPAVEIARRGREVAEALVYLHALGVVHRDVKPSNVLLDEEGRAHLADFGIAAVAMPEEGEGLVLGGGGSRGSMSPQQRRGEPPDPGDDVYALGALLRELLTGTSVPPRLRELVDSMLASEAGERPGMEAVARALGEIEAALGTAVAVSPPGVRLQPPPRIPDAAVRLQPPPRVPDAAVLPSAAPPRRDGTRPPPARSFPLAHATLLGSLALAALFVVLVLPRWAKAPSASPATAAPPDLAAPESPAAAEAPPPASPSSPPAEATPSPAEATPTASVARAAAPEPTPPASVREGAESPPARRTERSAPRGVEPPGEETRARQEFESAMSDAVAALDAGDYAAARRALERASAVRPGEAVVADGLRRVEEGDRAVALARHRDAAAALESKEDWWGALAEYEAALRLDPTVAFALDGRGRAARRARLADRLEFHARHEERLTTEAVAREAEGVLQEAREVDSPGPRLRLQVGALERALARSRVVVRVVLRSDGVTNVVVQRVGAIGAFEEKSLELRPGSYVVVGTRRGYRDVRRTLVVDPEAPPAPLLVRCEEAI